MDIVVPHIKFRNQRLSIRTAGIFDGPIVLLNDLPIKRINSKYHVRNDLGEEIVIKLKSNFLDPMPKAMIGEESVMLALPFTWYEYLWIGVPILLVSMGGAIGAGLGMVAAYVSGRIFRSARSVGFRYLLSGLVSVSAFLIFVILSIAIRILFNFFN